ADAGRTEESSHWRQVAATRYDELVARHPEAFADHAAEFWLCTGGDTQKALRLAQINFAIRKTPRANALLSRAVAANDAANAWCSWNPEASQSTTSLPNQRSMQ